MLQNPESPFSVDEVGSVSKKRLSIQITLKWVDAFLSRYIIVIRKRSGSLSRSPAQIRFIEKTVAYLLRQLQRLFDIGDLNESMVENMDETHFIFNMDNQKALEIQGVQKVNYADVVSGGDDFTMVLRLCGGVNVKLEDLFLISKN